MESKAQREFRNTVGMTFISLDPGVFMMGSPEEEPGRYEDEILHKVTLTKGFYMQTTPVTVGQWKSFVDATGFFTQAEKEDGAIGLLDADAVGESEEEWGKNVSCIWKTPGFAQTDEHPVTCVSMYDIQAFIEWLNREDEQNCYRLPTEAEWEYACRAGKKSIFTFGDCLSPEDANFNDAVNSLTGCSNSGVNRKHTTPVSMFRKNSWGLYDMHGNVLERCQDQCDWDKESDAIISNTYTEGVVDPLGCQGALHIARGGGWSADAKHSRAACRIKYDPNDRYSFLGFRLAVQPAY
jgi:formylglycine-generating enzyme required for sulfatase activity